MNIKLLLLMGPSGVGKTTIINQLIQIDKAYLYIAPYISRPLRIHETDKVSVDDARLSDLERRGELLVVNVLYGVRYGTPRRPIEDALLGYRYPVVDWPITRLSLMQSTYSQKLVRVYIEPSNWETLELRIRTRTEWIERLEMARRELSDLDMGLYDDVIDYRIVNEADKQLEVAMHIHEYYMKSIGV